jgi:hypothetical protein
MSVSSTHRFDNRPAQLALGGVGAIITIIGLAGLAGGLAAAPVYVGSGIVFAVRALRSSSVELRADTVVLRSIIHTRQLRLDELAGVAIRTGRTGLTGVNRQYLSFETTGGGTVDFKEFNAPNRPGPAGNVVERARDLIDLRIRQDSGGVR